MELRLKVFQLCETHQIPGDLVVREHNRLIRLRATVNMDANANYLQLGIVHEASCSQSNQVIAGDAKLLKLAEACGAD